MRGLNNIERAILSRCSGNPTDRYATEDEAAVIWELVAQGRVGLRRHEDVLVPFVTALGQEARRLDEIARQAA